MTKSRKKRKIPRRMVLWGIGGLLWLGVLFGAAIPVWRQAVTQHRKVQDLEVRLADLDNWTVAGLWLEKSLAPRRAVIDPQWERLFPAGEDKGELFLDLAGVADRSGVAKFELREQAVPDGLVVGEVADGESLSLSGYRVKARFQGRYGQVAAFLGGLKEIKRAVSVHNLKIKPARGVVQVDLELDVYVSATDQS